MEVKLLKAFKAAGIFPASHLKLLTLLSKEEKPGREDVKTEIREGVFYVYKDGFYPYALMTSSGDFFNLEGERHRVGDLPSMQSELSVSYHKDGELHRDAALGPAYVLQGELELYFERGLLHRGHNLPAEVSFFPSGKVSCKRFYSRGLLHREGGRAAVIWYFESGRIECEVFFAQGVRLRAVRYEDEGKGPRGRVLFDLQ